ncbi:ABC transporter substrate-binding protein [Evansella sp. AB-rgal1]|uniref:ABC transporter substrate-binding protein n=1 Tax=Evansella sp. AB-rgal1 TaxID=3242696 RepID=UPI00359D7EFF
MKMKNIFWVSILCFFLLIGCNTNTDGSQGDSSGNDDEDIVIRVAWWGGQDRHDKTMEVIELFEAEYPHITIEPEFTGWDSYWERLNTQAAGSNLPDVLQMDYSRLNDYNENDLIIDLAPLIENGTINLDDVEDVYQDMNTVGDNVMAISLGANTISLLYDKDMLDKYGVSLEPGHTYDELMERLSIVSEGEGSEYYGFDFANNEYELFYLYARQNGEEFFNDEGTDLGFSKQTLHDYLDLMKEMLDNEISPPHDFTMEFMNDGTTMLQNGYVAASMGSSNQLVAFSKTTDLNLGVTLLPALQGGVHGNWIRPSQSFVISSHSQQEEAAAMFIDFVTNNLEANEILKAERGVPISSKVREHLLPIVDNHVKETFEFLEIAEDYSSDAFSSPPAGESEIAASFFRAVEHFKYGRITVEEAVEQFFEEAEQLLQ